MMGPIEAAASLDDVFGAGAEALLRSALERRLLDGAAVGLVREGRCWVRVVGDGIEAESQFELGSLTKVFTAELLAILVERGVVGLDDPVGRYLPHGVAEVGAEPVRLVDLATHRSGLPRVPGNFGSVLAADPYAGYGFDRLDEFLKTQRLQKPAAAEFLYSNLGYALLGYALARAAGVTYEELLRREILEPLGMGETALAMTGRSLPRLVSGQTQAGLPAAYWTFDAFAPVGALCSTAGNQLKWLSWLLEDTDRLSMRARAEAGGGQVGLGWMIRPGGESCWHNGGTGGFSSYMAVHRGLKYGLVVLTNRHAPELVMTLGSSFERYLMGKPVAALAGDYGRGRARVLEPIRWVARPLMSLPGWVRYGLVGAGVMYCLVELIAAWARR